MIKTITYGIMHMVVATLVAYALSGSWLLATSIGLIEPLVQTGFYHVHEWVWDKIRASETSVAQSLTRFFMVRG